MLKLLNLVNFSTTLEWLIKQSVPVSLLVRLFEMITIPWDKS